MCEDETVGFVLRGCRGLKELKLCLCPRVSGAVARDLRNFGERLELLDLTGDNRHHDASAGDHAKRMTQMRTIELERPRARGCPAQCHADDASGDGDDDDSRLRLGT
eukprot:2174676-Rhodomonas_salina.2